jgi:hypothetical protein
LFRVPGFPEELKAVREALEQGRYQVMSLAESVNSVAAIFKLWFRELKEPLIPDQF